MKNKILVQVDTFINGKESIDLTLECLKRAKLLGFPILVTAHSEIPEEICRQADFVEIDLCNPLLEKNGAISSLNTYSEGYEIRIRLRDLDPHAPACLRSIINGATFSKKNGFDFFLRIEYDSLIKHDFAESIKFLLDSASKTNGLIFTNFEEWIDGKFIFCNSELYLKCFGVDIDSGIDYLQFVSDQGVEEKNWRHLQAVQYHILRKNYVLQNMFLIPSAYLESFLDKDFIQNREQEVGIFRPAKVINGGGEKFATIAHGFSRYIPFNFRIYTNGELQSIEEQFFVGGSTTYKIYPIFPETLHKISYTNPVTLEKEEWEFYNSDELLEVATITFR